MNTPGTGGVVEKFYSALPETVEHQALPTIEIQFPTAQDEWVRIKNYFEYSDFYFWTDYLHRIPLPEQNPFPFYISQVLGKGQRPSADEYDTLENVFLNDVFDERAYDNGIALLERCIPDLEEFILPVMRDHHNSIGFYIPPHGYKIKLARFGTTGSYVVERQDDSEQSELTILYTGAEDALDLLERIVHEMSHVGFAAQLIKPGEFRHDEKESLVDEYIIAHFGNMFPEYECQGNHALKDDKFQKLLQAVLYVCKIYGIDLPAPANGDPRQIRDLLERHSTIYYNSPKRDIFHHRSRQPLIRVPLNEHLRH